MLLSCFCSLSVMNGIEYKSIVSIFDHFVARQILVWHDRMKVNVLIDIITSSFEPVSSSLSKSIANLSLYFLNQYSCEHQIFRHDDDDWNIPNYFSFIKIKNFGVSDAFFVSFNIWTKYVYSLDSFVHIATAQYTGPILRNHVSTSYM